MNDIYKNMGISEEEKKLMDKVYTSKEEDLSDSEKIFIIRCPHCQKISHFQERKTKYTCQNEDCKKEFKSQYK